MSDRIQLESISGIPYITEGANIGEVVLEAARASGISFEENDILCIASKAVSVAEGQTRQLEDVEVSEVAKRIHESIPRKDPRVIQTIIDETGVPDGSKVELGENFIAGWLPNGLRLTSAGVDKHGEGEVILLPADPDTSARIIGKTILEATGVHVGIIITDSDGRIDKRGATQVAIGVYGIPPLRVSDQVEGEGRVKKAEETVCDMMAAAAGLIMGQRGTNKPVVLVRGFPYAFDEARSITNALSRPGQIE